MRKEVAAGTLVAVPLTQPGLSRPLAILHRRVGSLSPAATRFLEMVRSEEPAGGKPSAEEDSAAPIPDGKQHRSPRRAKVTS